MDKPTDRMEVPRLEDLTDEKIDELLVRWEGDDLSFIEYDQWFPLLVEEIRFHRDRHERFGIETYLLENHLELLQVAYLRHEAHFEKDPDEYGTLRGAFVDLVVSMMEEAFGSKFLHVVLSANPSWSEVIERLRKI